MKTFSKMNCIIAFGLTALLTTSAFASSASIVRVAGSAALLDHEALMEKEGYHLRGIEDRQAGDLVNGSQTIYELRYQKLNHDNPAGLSVDRKAFELKFSWGKSSVKEIDGARISDSAVQCSITGSLTASIDVSKPETITTADGKYSIDAALTFGNLVVTIRDLANASSPIIAQSSTVDNGSPKIKLEVYQPRIFVDCK